MPSVRTRRVGTKALSVRMYKLFVSRCTVFFFLFSFMHCTSIRLAGLVRHTGQQLCNLALVSYLTPFRECWSWGFFLITLMLILNRRLGPARGWGPGGRRRKKINYRRLVFCQPCSTLIQLGYIVGSSSQVVSLV